MTIAAQADSVDRRPLAPTPSLRALRDGCSVYRRLTGRDPGNAPIESEDDFDAHVLASILAVAATEDGPLCQRTGLASPELARLIARWFPCALMEVHAGGQDTMPDGDELVMVRDLLLANRSTDGDEGRWLAHMVARRAIEPSHLWEDLGLRNRAELSRLLDRHFAPLAVRNTRGMRWKRFFYRMLCEDDGFVMCTTPVCTDCCDFENCFGEEDGESRLARRRRDAAASSVPV
ncbi:MAG: nitrogen fixation protein NifQ [Hyphomicrobium sp.]|uniref:nitrogen fixation protein NifQ n=1 Tax=Hyphomicrobium sp. TaxID=82 RepID=UPI00132290BB|nr:nitrogen fixation protein NifQ [Hyphomicrobium sp.]KAB2943991.1 MAG: nitrogen fixation protein NifQ [Hyphomicrobium sp.]MBZ0209281.1 nitrogen fixation protein NifQ [Hyphomicrobium sp.]